MDLKTVRTIESKCCTCGSLIDSHSSENGAEPEKDDITVCCYCGTFSKFDENLNLVKMTIPELLVIAEEDPDSMAGLLNYQSAIKMELRAIKKDKLTKEEYNEFTKKFL
jgi:hypothetical protein